MIFYNGAPDYGDIYQTEQVKIDKIIHVKGTDNYLAYDDAGKKYNIDTEDTIVKTGTKSSTMLSYDTPRSNVSRQVIKHYSKCNSDNTQELIINLTPKMSHAKTEEWRFN